MKKVKLAEVKTAFSALERFDFGSSTEALETIEAYVQKSETQPELRNWLTQAFTAALRSRTSYGVQKYACQQLWILGGDQALPVLTTLLTGPDPHAAEAACYAISQRPSVMADTALKQALTETKGPVLLAIVNLVGDRRDPESLSPLLQLVSGPNDACAEAVARALGKIATPDACKALLRFLSEGGRRRPFAAAGLLEAGRELSGRGDLLAARDVLVKLAASDPPPHILRGAKLRLERLTPEYSQWQSLFNGRDLADFDIDTASVWSVREGVIIGSTSGLKYNEFLRTKKHYKNFILRGKLRLIDGAGNSGFQFRSEPVPDSHEVSGFQADAADGFWGNLYDESRRRTILAKPPDSFLKQVDPTAWHSYVVSAQGNHIRIDVDGVQTVDYEERDPRIPQTGFIALQVHAGPPSEVWFRDLQIQTL